MTLGRGRVSSRHSILYNLLLSPLDLSAVNTIFTVRSNWEGPSKTRDSLSGSHLIRPRESPRATHRACSSLQQPSLPRNVRFERSMSAAALQAILDNPRYHDYLAILKGARNGLVYGFKVRFPHALIMAILFGRGECVTGSTTSPPFPPTRG